MSFFLKPILTASAAVLLLTGCQSAYYNTMEKFGVEKRDILVSRIEEARDAQEDTRDEFVSALDQFSSLVNFEGGDLEKTYDTLRRQFERSEEAASEVRERIGKIESVGAALFREWEAEIGEYSSENLRRESRRAMEQTRTRYDILISKMRDAEATMYPVLDLFRDQVLFLKHNLNAKAVAALDTEAGEIRVQVERLIAEMEDAINSAEAFITSMR